MNARRDSVAVMAALALIGLLLLTANQAKAAEGRQLSGIVGYAVPGLGADYLAMRLPRGTHVHICGPAGCVNATVNDYGPSRRLHPDRIADLSYPDFAAVCGPHSMGLCRATATTIRVPGDLPATDTSDKESPMRTNLYALALAAGILTASAGAALADEPTGTVVPTEQATGTADVPSEPATERATEPATEPASEPATESAPPSSPPSESLPPSEPASTPPSEVPPTPPITCERCPSTPPPSDTVAPGADDSTPGGGTGTLLVLLAAGSLAGTLVLARQPRRRA
jgi:hypothetical protein